MFLSGFGIFFGIGLYQLVKLRQEKLAQFIWWLFIVTPISASFLYHVPHASRAVYLIIPTALTISFGGVVFWQWLKLRSWRFLALPVIIGLVAINAILFYLDYYIDYPKRSSESWIEAYQLGADYYKDNYWRYSQFEFTALYWLPEVYIYWEMPFLIKTAQPLKQAMLNDPVNGFGMPDPLTYLKNEQPDLTGRRLPKGMLVDPKASIPQNFQITNTLYFANGEPALLLLTELK